MKTAMFKLVRCDNKTPARLGVWPAALAVLATATLAWGASDEASPVSTEPPPPAPAVVQTPPEQTPATAPLSAGPAEVVKMLKAGVDTRVIKAYIDTSAGTFHLNADEIITLYQQRVNSDLIQAMLRQGTPTPVNETAGQPANPTPPVQPAPEVNANPPVQPAPEVALAPPAPPAPEANYAPPAVNDVYAAPPVTPAYTYVDPAPGYVVYPPSGYVSVGVAWPYYYRYGRVWHGARYSAPVHYSAPRSSGVTGRASVGPSHSSGSSRSAGPSSHGR